VKRLTVSSDASTVELSPTLNGVAYISQGVVLVRPIIQMPKDLFLIALKAADRAKAMNNAKQVALGIIMYSGDHDDVYPSNQSDIGKLIEPYMRDSGIFSGFVYSYGGGLATEIKNPAETTIGHMPGPGGKAVVCADGHVKWQPD
jgi:hypothetical protein